MVITNMVEMQNQTRITSTTASSPDIFMVSILTPKDFGKLVAPQNDTRGHIENTAAREPMSTAPVCAFVSLINNDGWRQR